MQRDSVAQLNEEVLYLYSAGSLRELGEYLHALLRELFQNVDLSLVSAADRAGEVVIEYSTSLAGSEYSRPAVAAEALVERIRVSASMGRTEDVEMTLASERKVAPVFAVRALPTSASRPGALVFHSRLIPAWAGSDRVFQDGLLYHAGAAFDRLHARQCLEDRVEAGEARIHAMHQISEVLGQLDLESLLCHLLSVCLQLAEAQVGSIILEGKDTVEVEWGLPRKVLAKLCDLKGAGVLASVLQSQELVHVDYRASPNGCEVVDEFSIESILAVPLVAKGRSLGAVSLVNVWGSRGGRPTEADRGSMHTLSSLGGIAVENALLHRDLIEKERFRANLQIARSIQRGLYPVSAPEISGYETAWLTRSCDETGGDYFDFLDVRPNARGFAIGDVSGHGIGAALLMATGRAYLRTLMSLSADLGDVVGRLNDLLVQDMDAEKFMTLFLAALDPETHTLRYVSAGHDRPLVYRAGDGSVVDLGPTGVPLGMVPGWVYRVGEAISLGPGDAILLTTDGVWEAVSASGKRFGKDRIRAALATHGQASARRIIDAILEEVETYTAGAPAADDFTLVVLKRQG
jgi:sigma-B regulation protein RsbU (phosphoserine phosphatase)